MSDNEQFHYQFIHNVFGCFIENTLEYFGEYFYPRYQHLVVGTYDKAVQYIVNQERDGKEVDKPNLPALILNPTDFSLDDANAGGKQFWRFPHLAPGLAQRLFDPIYIDRNVEITVAFTRLKGELELLSLLPSFYEYFDLKIFIIQMFGGEGRYISPIYFNDFIILPPELVNYEYKNSITGESYILDWKNNGAYEFLVETTNKNELVIPGKIKPRYVLRGLTDGSTRYGGTDDIADWKLSAMVEYEIEIPSYIILKTDFGIETISFNIGYGSVYSKYPEFNVPNSEIITDIYLESNLQDNSNTIINRNNDGFMNNLSSNENTNSLTNPDLLNADIEYNTQSTGFSILTGNNKIVTELGICPGERTRREIVFKTRYFHQITQEQQDSVDDVFISLPEKIYDISLIKLQSRYGLMEYGFHYTIENSSDEIRLIVTNIKLIKNDFIEIFIYETPFSQQNPIHIFGGSSIISITKDLYTRPALNVKWAFRSTVKCKSIVEGEI